MIAAGLPRSALHAALVGWALGSGDAFLRVLQGAPRSSSDALLLVGWGGLGFAALAALVLIVMWPLPAVRRSPNAAAVALPAGAGVLAAAAKETLSVHRHRLRAAKSLCHTQLAVAAKGNQGSVQSTGFRRERFTLHGVLLNSSTRISIWRIWTRSFWARSWSV